ncbi:MAG: serine/threonine-protein kinase [Blautia sp.]|nr:serine/threonine-protein kinase [Blautia sp.]MDY5030425.1 serine/threonine-protein kinase [Blautia sp.]
MDVNKLCFGCMKENENQGQPCPYCGFDINEYMKDCSARVLRPGTILNGQYLVGKVLGEGGFGITYLAMDLNLEFPVAIKEYFPAGLAVRDASERSIARISVLSGEKSVYYQQGLERFTEEAKSLIRFRHEEGIVQVNTFFYENGTAYMVMEYIHGKSLKQYLQGKNAPLTEAETFRIMMPILKMLEKVHKAGIIHRDISPDNIMLGTDGKVYLIDFGAARMITGAESKSLDVVLKPGYTPFEQYYSRGNMGPWTDVYAVCATMYRMLSGKVPQESLARLDQNQLETLYTLSEKREIPSVSQRTSQSVEKGMSLKREERYQSIDELLIDLTEEEKNAEKSVVSEKKQKAEKAKEEKIHKERHKEKVEKKHSRKKYLIAGGTAAALLIFVSGFGMWSHPELFRSAEKCYELGCEYYEREDYQKAYKLLKKAADTGNTEAQYQLGNCFYEGTGVEQNTETAIELYEEAADAGNADAQKSLSAAYYSLGQTYYGESDYKEAVKWYEKASDAGNVDAQYQLGNCYCEGTGVEQNTEIAIEWYEKAADEGNEDARNSLSEICYSLGNIYYDETDYEKAVELYKKASDAGNVDAQYQLGNCYCEGTGVEQNTETAIEWYEKAADEGNEDARNSLSEICYSLGNIYYDETDYEKAVELFKKAAEAGNAEAQYQLGNYYYDEEDYNEAVKWYEKAAEYENVQAQYMVGSINFYNGNYEKAIEWYEKAAEYGLADAQYSLGLCYYYEYGVKQDKQIAEDYFYKAAEQGDFGAEMMIKYGQW